ncbi:Alcohol dehydrogenase [Pseudovibrio axinellae]|uniref:alcohol dehydrogenase n=1 Tax=Pseudovibrio axinellae TaxID=989403 RepID=A0A165UNA6_9HYPH|nr:zinc-dependent alcohol dehydrogenase family protein [Pseudovibrio axinellae]KZL12599.1 Alcohol dehydrogenase [Pseudovibrio axinellae]SEP65041.1 alcohol dehydrogenase, propanol-preferring [Pseudovibrio axinellae]
MKAMVLTEVGKPLVLHEKAVTPPPQAGEVLVQVEACAVCRTDLHVVDGDLKHPKLPLIPGHEIVGRVRACGTGVHDLKIGTRVGIPWLGHTCGCCSFCRIHQENLCDDPVFTGYTRDGGFATHTVADRNFAFELDSQSDPVSLAPLLCAGLIGWRALKKAGGAGNIGLYGFGAAAHITAQICIWQGRNVFAFTRPQDHLAQEFAKTLGVAWAGSSLETPPKKLDAAIIFAPVGDLVPVALNALRKGGRVVCAGIHMSDIPQMPYSLLWQEREVVSVANLTREDAKEFFPLAKEVNVKTQCIPYKLEQANEALEDLRNGSFSGAAVLVP